MAAKNVLNGIIESWSFKSIKIPPTYISVFVKYFMLLKLSATIQ